MPLPIIAGATAKFGLPIAGSLGRKVFGSLSGIFGSKKRAGESDCIPCRTNDPDINLLHFLFINDPSSLAEAHSHVIARGDNRCKKTIRENGAAGVVQALIFDRQGGGNCKISKQEDRSKALVKVLVARSLRLQANPPRVPNPRLSLARSKAAAEDFVSGKGIPKAAIIGSGVLIVGIVIFLIARNR